MIKPVLILILFILVSPLSARQIPEGLEYEIKDSGSVTITKCTENATVLTPPFPVPSAF
ncbi:MAG: hypothetical protein LBB81_05965 [Treponema sp.]|jgi:hypothetical protein|nr:hypothetical protein [Treponema sp.]